MATTTRSATDRIARRTMPRVVGTSALKLRATPPGRDLADLATSRQRRRHLVLVPGGAGAPRRVLPQHSTVVSRPAGRWDRRGSASPAPAVTSPVEQQRRATARERSEQAPWRLSSRGLALIRALGVATLIAMVALGATLIVRSDPGSPRTTLSAAGSLVWNSTDTVVVAPGQSLWQIAQQVDPKQDPRELVARIVELNRLRGQVIQPGQVLRVPAA